MKPRTAVTAWGLLVAAVLVLVPLGLRDRLPDPLAVHWTDAPVPDNSMSFTANLVTPLVVWGVMWAVLLGLVFHGRSLERRNGRAFLWGSMFGGGVFMVGVGGAVLLANLDAPTWTQARMPFWSVGVVVPVSLAVGVLAGFLCRGAPDQRPPASERPPTLRLRPGQRSVWVSRTGNPWLVAVTGAAFVVTVVTVVVALPRILSGAGALPWSVLIGPVIVLIAGLLVSSVTARVTGDGLAIGFGLLGWPIRRIRLSKIDSAWSEVRYPSQTGGWGFRGFPGTATIMLRGGECLVIRYRSGGQLAISIDDAEHGAALINALIAERVEA